MAGSLQLEILYRGEPAFCVPEYAELELRLSNKGQPRLPDCQVKIGSQIIKEHLALASGATWSFPYNVADLAGELCFEAVASPKEAALANVQVVPQKISLAELLFIKTERLPTLLARLDAPNRLQLAYQKEDAPPFDFFSLDYSAEKLEYFSRQLLETNLSDIILNRLDYLIPPQTRRGAGLIAGTLDWNATLQTWFNHPEWAGYLHQWTNSPKFFGTPPNLLFARFHFELAGQWERLQALVKTARPVPSRLQAKLPKFSALALTHSELIQNSPLAQFRAALNFPSKDAGLVAQLQHACAKAANPAYKQLFELWQSFLSRYVSLPNEIEAHGSGLQPMSKIYELWAVCEMAAALGLTFKSGRGWGDPSDLSASGFRFEGNTSWGNTSLYYNRAVRGGWYSASRSGLPRPDIRLELGAKRQLFFDVKYRVNQQPDGSTRAKSEDMYKMLAYMSDFSAETGGIIYPGEVGQILGLVIENRPTATPQNQQRLIELALRPPLENPATLSETLYQQLQKALG